MKGDKNIFVTFNKIKEEFIFFGNDNYAKTIGKCIISLGSKDAVVENILLLDYMKHNFRSVGQMCD